MSGYGPTKVTSHDDESLRAVFDSNHFWKNFQSRRSSSNSSSQGLVGNHYLTHPKGFIDFSKDTVTRCRRLAAEVIAASSVEQYRTIPRVLDRLSDSLCRVLDVADFVRITHPDEKFKQASAQAYAMLFEYMNILNTTPDLKIQLEKAVTTPEVSMSWGDEEKIVAQILLKDFSKSAIDLPHDQRQLFVNLSNRVSQLGSDFVRNIRPETAEIAFHHRQLKGVDPLVLHHSRKRHLTGISIPTVGLVAATALRSMKDEGARQLLYIAGRKSPRSQLQTLQDFLQTRAQIANLSGCRSYADLNLSDKLAKSPAAVSSFLRALSKDNKAQVRREMEELLAMKRLDSDATKNSLQIEAWDREYYRAQQAKQQRAQSRRPDFMSAYFSLGTVMQGLSRLFRHLYGVRFEPAEISPSEAWNSDVRRLNIIDEKEGHIAVLYCDLFARDGKSPNPAHFTLRCSRRIFPSEVEESSALHSNVDPFQAANDGMAVSRSPTTGNVYQLPTIALICDFQANEDRPSEPTLLSFREMQTLFHEMGHAIHSILGRTSCQVISGTRCATDFAELPSVLMEHFAADPTVLGLFARHWQTDRPLPYDMVAEQLATDRKGRGVETETQILLAMLDQAYHSELPLTMARDEGGFDSTRVLQDIFERHGSVREPRETSAQGFFGHLVEYGGMYYSYLFDRAIAGKIWQVVFNGGREGGAISRERGQRFRDEVLRWGGGRDGWRCIAGVLGDERLKDGGAEAMAEVGRWGVED